jgi:hypothetical protein
LRAVIRLKSPMAERYVRFGVRECAHVRGRLEKYDRTWRVCH